MQRQMNINDRYERHVFKQMQYHVIIAMDGLRNHGPLGLDMLKAPPARRKKLGTRKTRTHTQTPLGVYVYFLPTMCWILRSN